MNRRALIKRLAATATFLGMAQSLPAFHYAANRGKRMGIVVHSYAFRGNRNQKSKKYPPFQDAVELLEHVHVYGAGGVQTKVSGWSKDLSRRIRKRIETLDMYIEGSIRTPKTQSDVERFESEVVNAKEAGATVFRTAMGGRRYENFSNRDGWKRFKEQAWKSLRLAEPVVSKHRVRLAVENHKDWQLADLVEIMNGMSSETIGVTIDTGNSIALLEHPDETVHGLAKYGFTTHIKDMGVQEYQDGFLLSEVPIGHGFLDMERIFNTVEKHNPDIRFNLEMITRNPLKVPCLKKSYWATFADQGAGRLAKAMSWVRANVQEDLPSVEGKTLDECIEYEELNNRLSVLYAEKRLGLQAG